MLKLNRLNRKGNLVECLIVVENIDGVTEKEMDNIPLFDEDGNQVDEKVVENVFEIHFNTGASIFVNKETYDKLQAKLNVETL